MSKIFVTSDQHFNHQNIITYCPQSRSFNSVLDMNETLIERWNSVIGPEDEVIQCGDFFMGQSKDIDSILPRLNGKITVVRGNHETKARMDKYREHGIEVKDIKFLAYKGRFFIFCHFPIASQEFMDMVREDNSEVIACYGHVHDKAPTGLRDGTFHVGVDTNNLTPVSLDYIWGLSKDEQERKKVPDQVLEDLESDLKT